jgi:tetratricopeptide (TPR) repeat protein
MPAIEKLIAAKKWKQAQALLQDELLTAPSDHWVWTTLGLTYYEQHLYDKALTCSKRAIELAPDCPLVLWDYAGCLYMTGRESAALAIWTVLLDMDPEDVANGECSEGMDWALQLLNDVHYRMGRYFQRNGNASQARVSFEKYLHNREHGVGSIYHKKDVERFLQELNQPENHAAHAVPLKRAKQS